MEDKYLLLQTSQWEELRETSHQRTAQVSHFRPKHNINLFAQNIQQTN